MLAIIIIVLVLIFLVSAIAGGFDLPKKFHCHYSRLLPTKRLQYEKGRPDCSLINLKLGQRKLLTSELEFFLAHLQPADVVVYAGSAPGSHSVIWPEIFPNKFIFYDPNPFDSRLTKIETHQEYFTKEVCEELHKKYSSIIFLSDIRTGSNVENVAIDMDLQAEWCEILKPRMAMLKFRLPWVPGTTEYYAGDIYLQTRHPNNSTETRLWTDCRKKKLYDNNAYNDQNFYFQILARNAFYDFKTPNVEGIDHCYDCWAETLIYNKLAKKLGVPVEEIFEMVAKNTSPINVPPHGVYPNEKNTHKRMKMLEKITTAYNNEKDAKENARNVFRAEKQYVFQVAKIYEKYHDQLRFSVLKLFKTSHKNIYTPDESLSKSLKIQKLQPFENTCYHCPERALAVCIAELNVPGPILINTEFYDIQVERILAKRSDVKFYVYFNKQHTAEFLENVTFVKKELVPDEFKFLPKIGYFYNATTKITPFVDELSKTHKSTIWVDFGSTSYSGEIRPLPYIDKKLLWAAVTNPIKGPNPLIAEKLFYFNINCRDAYWPHSEKSLDHCYSCWRELAALKGLVEKPVEFMLSENGFHNIVLDKPHLMCLDYSNPYERLRQLEPLTVRHAEIIDKINKEIRKLNI